MPAFVAGIFRLGYPSIVWKRGLFWLMTGSVARALRVDTEVFSTIPFLFLSETARSNRAGWTVGGGLEWMFAPNWSVFAEYSYMDFGRTNIAFANAPGTFGAPTLNETRLTLQTALVGVNYKFNWGGPVLAKY